MRACNAHLSTGTIHLAVAADQHADSRAIDVLELGHIDHQLAGALLDHALDRGLEAHQFVAQIQVSRQFHDGHVRFDLADLRSWHGNDCIMRSGVDAMGKTTQLLLSATILIAPAFAQVDFSGEWAPLYHEDAPERLPGPELGDYTELPLNDAARLRADSWDADRISVVEQYQCRPHGSDYSMRGLGNMRVSREHRSGDAAFDRISHAHAGVGQ